MDRQTGDRQQAIKKLMYALSLSKLKRYDVKNSITYNVNNSIRKASVHVS